MHIEKSKVGKTFLRTSKIFSGGYEIPCVISFIMQYYAFEKCGKLLGFFYAVLTFFTLGVIITIFLQNYKRNQKYKKNIINGKLTFKMIFRDENFTFGYKNHQITTIPYQDILRYDIVKNSLVLDLGYVNYVLDLKIFSKDEKEELIKCLSHSRSKEE